MMSAELYDGELTGALAQPSVDILPALGGRKGKSAATELEPLPAPMPEPVPEAWAAVPPAPVNPWTGAPAEAGPPAAAAAAPAPVGQVPAPAPEWPSPVAVPLPPLVDTPVAEAPVTEDAPKKFFGMQVRRPKKAAPAAEDAPSTDHAQPTEAVVAPIAAWPTDVGVPAVADAEPNVATGGYSAPAPFAPIDLLSAGPADAPPIEAPTPQAPVLEAPVAPAVEFPVLVAPAVEAPAAPAPELVALRALLEASESQRLAAENRADQAVAYAQQTQARLQQLESDGQARIQSAETRARSAANEAQDWQIRHREAEATIAELALSVSGSEQRMAELRTERDELIASLEDATAPEQHTPTS